MHAAYVAHVQGELAEQLPAVVVLGIDETRRGKQIWRQDAQTGRWVPVSGRWHTGFVDAAGTGGLLAQVEGLCAAAVTAWPNEQPQAWRNTITHAHARLARG